MPDTESDTTGGATTATAEPPQPPAGPPATGAATSEPDRPGRRLSWGCLIALSLVLVLVVVPGLGALAWWRLAASTPTRVAAPAQVGAFASAMAKAGVKASPQPTAPVELASVKPVGSHHFEATFTFGELDALLGAFSHSVAVGGTPVTLSNATLSPDGGNGIALQGETSAAGASYSGKVSGPVAYGHGQIVAPNGLSVSAAGIPIPGAQGKQVTKVLLAYANGYLAAAPGLTVDSASVATDGVHASGTAPDSISW